MCWENVAKYSAHYSTTNNTRDKQYRKYSVYIEMISPDEGKSRKHANNQPSSFKYIITIRLNKYSLR